MLHNLSEQLLLLSMNVVFCVAACNNAEYEVKGECCPMCDPGNRVYRPCDKFTSTTCYSCLEKTFTNAPNGLTECLPCSVCDQSNGLRVKKTCTLISDTACEPLPGYYCIESLSNCKNAMKHSSCSAGQYISRNGTEIRDTECEDCPSGSYSDGTICKWHTNCEALGKETIQKGTGSTDAECSNKTRSHSLTLILCGVWSALLMVIIAVIAKKKKKENVAVD
ncbi:tumor necrosis factor receptor superfamily member 14-like [Puntigrus tetrazona]|uniref:tumor necrosis factor receptor superfamily member 14-like n=1 Tax=Puntigrus tetrazona TaxID=1606681 RepID=UPI001C89B677|nr:tumor necrosis factor receptor superfamily member 14-like [Puntigrus tetrazona]XP_043090319.1 tumor necrosis factor receptor superfamily member 14-like [Puntigrus tetrazona]XP_043090320.1 tumor necrosis factor receptor superfamily member 14-like [Puntigrus tetrazona]